MSIWGKVKGAAKSTWGKISGAATGGGSYSVPGYEFDESAQQPHSDFEAYLAEQYRDQIEGRSPSLAQAQLRDATERAQQSQLAMARSGTGPLGGQAAQHTAARQMAALQSQAARDASSLRAQEYQAGMAGGSQLAQGALQREQQYELGKGGLHYQGHGIQAGAHEGAAGRRAGAFGSVLGAVGSMGGAAMLASDPELKRDIRQEDPSELDRFLEDLVAYRYKYKHGDPREHTGVMATDLERSPVGASMVVDTPEGKGIETAGFGTALAAMGRLAERIEMLEKGRR